MEISYFGEIAEKTNKTSENLKEISSVNSLITFLKDSYQMSESDYHIAVNHNLIEKSEEKILKDNDEIAVLSAFAGG